MVAGIGRSTDPSTATNRTDISGSEPASFRYNNPGAQYPSAEAARFGQTGHGIIGGGHKIARFPSPVNGAASNFDLLYRNYTGMTIGAAGTKWTGAHGFGVPGYDPNSILTKQMLDDATGAIALLKAIAARESGRGNNLTEQQWRQAHAMFKAGSADSYLNGLPPQAEIHTPAGAKTGAGLLQRARQHVGEAYVNVQVPKDDPNWKGPWDCAEFISWLVYQEAGILYGCTDNQASPAKADSYTGAWQRDVEKLGKRVTVEEAAATVGGIVLRYPPSPGKMGHIAVCDGKGGTVEAKGRRYGVVADTVHGRGWHTGVLVPGISYNSAAPITVARPVIVYEPNAPNMDKEIVIRIQQALAAKGFDPKGIDGDFGPDTQAAVAAFQEAEGLVVDGAVGPETAATLGVALVRTGEVPVAETGVPAAQESELRDGAARNPLLLILALTLLSKEKQMANDVAKPGQGTDPVSLLLPLLLQSALTGKQIDITQLLTALLTGKPPAPGPAVPTPGPAAPEPQPPAAPQAPADLLTLLLPLLLERLTGKPPAEPKVDTPTQPLQPALSRPSVQLGVAGLGITTILQALGTLGMPFGITQGPTNPTTTGTMATLIPLVVTALGATGGFGTLLGAGSTLLSGLASAANKPKP